MSEMEMHGMSKNEEQVDVENEVEKEQHESDEKLESEEPLNDKFADMRGE